MSSASPDILVVMPFKDLQSFIFPLKAAKNFSYFCSVIWIWFWLLILKVTSPATDYNRRFYLYGTADDVARDIFIAVMKECKYRASNIQLRNSLRLVQRHT